MRQTIQNLKERVLAGENIRRNSSLHSSSSSSSHQYHQQPLHSASSSFTGGGSKLYWQKQGQLSHHQNQLRNKSIGDLDHHREKDQQREFSLPNHTPTIHIPQQPSLASAFKSNGSTTGIPQHSKLSSGFISTKHATNKPRDLQVATDAIYLEFNSNPHSTTTTTAKKGNSAAASTFGQRQGKFIKKKAATPVQSNLEDHFQFTNEKQNPNQIQWNPPNIVQSAATATGEVTAPTNANTNNRVEQTIPTSVQLRESIKSTIEGYTCALLPNGIGAATQNEEKLNREASPPRSISSQNGTEKEQHAHSREAKTKYHLRDAMQRQEIKRLELENAQLRDHNKKLSDSLDHYRQLRNMEVIYMRQKESEMNEAKEKYHSSLLNIIQLSALSQSPVNRTHVELQHALSQQSKIIIELTQRVSELETDKSDLELMLKNLLFKSRVTEAKKVVSEATAAATSTISSISSQVIGPNNLNSSAANPTSVSPPASFSSSQAGVATVVAQQQIQNNYQSVPTNNTTTNAGGNSTMDILSTEISSNKPSFYQVGVLSTTTTGDATCNQSFNFYAKLFQRADKVIHPIGNGSNEDPLDKFQQQKKQQSHCNNNNNNNPNEEKLSSEYTNDPIDSNQVSLDVPQCDMQTPERIAAPDIIESLRCYPLSVSVPQTEIRHAFTNTGRTTTKAAELSAHRSPPDCFIFGPPMNPSIYSYDDIGGDRPNTRVMFISQQQQYLASAAAASASAAAGGMPSNEQSEQSASIIGTNSKQNTQINRSSNNDDESNIQLPEFQWNPEKQEIIIDEVQLAAMIDGYKRKHLAIPGSP